MSSSGFPSRSRRGVTAIELLVVVTIITVVTAIVLSTILSSKSAAKKTRAASAMHQFALGASLYTEDAGREPFSVADLVATRRVPRDLAESPDDDTRVGIANAWGDDLHVRHVDYKHSFVGLRENRLTTPWHLDRFKRGKAGGWLVDLTSLTPNPKFASDSRLLWQGTYHRLLFDGSVVRRTLTDVPLPLDGTFQMGRTPMALFEDFDPYDREWLEIASR